MNHRQIAGGSSLAITVAVFAEAQLGGIKQLNLQNLFCSAPRVFVSPIKAGFCRCDQRGNNALNR